MTLKVTGIQELIKEFNSLDASVSGPLLDDAARAGAQVIADIATHKAPIRTGALLKSLNALPDVDRESATRAVAYAGTPLRYAHIVEFGSRFMPARPYLRPARDESEFAVREAMIGIFSARLR